MTNFKFNANQIVKVKLTDFGVQILREQHEELNKNLLKHGCSSLGYFVLPLDEDGYYKCQLWYLMQKFGSHMRMGTDNPFELNMIFIDGEEIKNEH